MLPGTTSSWEDFLQPRRLPGPARGPLARPCSAWEAWRRKVVVFVVGAGVGWERRRERGRGWGWRKGRRVGRRLRGIVVVSVEVLESVAKVV